MNTLGGTVLLRFTPPQWPNIPPPLTVDTVLAGLGWDVHEPSQVYVEYPTPGGKWVDYALLRPSTGTPVAVIEAKAISQEEIRLWTADEDPGEIQEWEPEHLDQLEGYVNDLQLATGYAVLTDGASWDIYDLSRTGAFSGKGLHYFDTLYEVTEVSVTGLATLHQLNFTEGVS